MEVDSDARSDSTSVADRPRFLPGPRLRLLDLFLVMAGFAVAIPLLRSPFEDGFAAARRARITSSIRLSEPARFEWTLAEATIFIVAAWPSALGIGNVFVLASQFGFRGRRERPTSAELMGLCPLGLLSFFFLVRTLAGGILGVLAAFVGVALFAISLLCGMAASTILIDRNRTHVMSGTDQVGCAAAILNMALILFALLSAAG